MIDGHFEIMKLWHGSEELRIVGDKKNMFPREHVDKLQKRIDELEIVCEMVSREYKKGKIKRQTVYLLEKMLGRM